MLLQCFCNALDGKQQFDSESCHIFEDVLPRPEVSTMAVTPLLQKQLCGNSSEAERRRLGVQCGPVEPLSWEEKS